MATFALAVHANIVDGREYRENASTDAYNPRAAGSANAAAAVYPGASGAALTIDADGDRIGRRRAWTTSTDASDTSAIWHPADAANARVAFAENPVPGVGFAGNARAWRAGANQRIVR
jgi:hypothetical protein